jgi:predicted  nucleic acid-binding Zn-ribbon protein
MVDRAELLAALSEIKALKDEAQAKAKDHAWLEAQLVKAQEQVQSARVDAAKLRADMSAMVTRSDLEAARAQLLEAEAAARAESQKQREDMSALKERLGGLEKEKSTLEANMQVLIERLRHRFVSHTQTHARSRASCTQSSACTMAVLISWIRCRK